MAVPAKKINYLSNIAWYKVKNISAGADDLSVPSTSLTVQKFFI